MSAVKIIREYQARIADLEFRIGCLKAEHRDHEKDYLAVWKLIKRPDETVVDAVKRIVAENETLRDALELARGKALAAEAEGHCDDCDPSFLDCWTGNGTCRKKPVTARAKIYRAAMAAVVKGSK